MKTLIIIACLLFFGCKTTRAYDQQTKQIVDYGMSTYTDAKNNTICHIYRDADVGMMSCRDLKK